MEREDHAAGWNDPQTPPPAAHTDGWFAGQSATVVLSTDMDRGLTLGYYDHNAGGWFYHDGEKLDSDGTVDGWLAIPPRS